MFKSDLPAVAAVRNWVWSTTRKNWPVVKEKNVWAVNSEQKKRSAAKGDKIAFYVKGTNYFRGVFEAAGDWHGPTAEWPEAPADGEFEHEIDLKPVQLGYADLNKLSDKLEFIENKKRVGVYLRGSPNGPANMGRPVSDGDLRAILGELRDTQEKPTAGRSGDKIVNEAFIPVESWDFIKERVHELPPPELKNVSRIIDDVKTGKVAIPIFQREYTWRRKQIEELWESIFQGFFVGSVLTWAAYEQLTTMPVHGAPKLQDAADVVLDGQQRITSLYYAVSAPEAPLPNQRSTRFFVDLKALLDPRANSSDIVFSEIDKERQDLSRDERAQFARKAFPLEKLDNRDYVVWLTSFKEYLKDTEGFDEETARGYFNQILGVLDHVWFEYKIPVVRLPKSLTLDRVAGIFERINSKGEKLGVFDLLNSRFMKYDVSLRANWDATKADFDMSYVLDGADNAEKYILQGLALFKKGSARSKEILALDKSYTELRQFRQGEFLRDWREISKHTSEAIEQLKSQKRRGFGAARFSMIPYTVLIPLISSLMYKIEGRGDRPKCMDKIRTWYWSAVTSDRYSGSTDTKIERDYQQLLRWFEDERAVPEIVAGQRRAIDALDVDTPKKVDSVYKAVMCLVLKNGARDFGTGEELEGGALDDCHIFPKSGKSGHGGAHVDSVLNKTVLLRETNRRFLKGRMPSECIKKIMKEQNVGESAMRDVLKTHLISDEAFGCLMRDDFDGFVNARRDAVRRTLKALIVPADDGSGPGIDGLLYRHETHTLEYKSSLRWNVREDRPDAAMEEAVVKELCCFMNSEGGDLLIGVNDDGEPVGLAKDYGTFREPGADKFGKHMINLVNKYLHKPANAYVKLEFVKVDGLDVCWCRVKPSPKPVFLHKKDDAQFFARANNTCQFLNTKQATEYIAQHWS